MKWSKPTEDKPSNGPKAIISTTCKTAGIGTKIKAGYRMLTNKPETTPIVIQFFTIPALPFIWGSSQLLMSALRDRGDKKEDDTETRSLIIYLDISYSVPQ